MPSKTTNITTTYANLLRETEQTERAKYDAAAQRFSDLRDLPGRAEADLEDAQDALSSIEGAHSRYDGTGALPTPAEHADALSAVSLAELRVRGARLNAERAGRAYANTDTDVAQALARPVSAALPGVTVLTTFVPGRHLPTVRPADLPVAVVCQGSPTKHDTAAGNFSTENVEVHYLRGKIHSRLHGDDVETAFAQAGFAVEPLGFVASAEGADRTVDVMRLRVHSAHTTPVIPNMAEDAPRALASTFAHQIAMKCRVDGWGVRMLDRGGLLSSHVLVKADGAALVDREVTGGIRKVTVDASVLVRPTEEVWGMVPQPSYAVETIIRDMAAGGFVPGLGVVESVELLPVSSDSPLALAIPETASRLDSIDRGPRDAHRSPLLDSQYIVRAVLHSSTGEAA